MESFKVSSKCKKLMISSSSSNTHQLVILSGIEDLKINSTKHASGWIISEGISFKATLDTRLELEFWECRIMEILNVMKFSDNSQTRCLYFFKWLERQCMVLRTCLTMISKSPNTFRYCTFTSIAFFKTWMSSSYSVVLLVHSNWRWHAMNVLIMYGSVRTWLALVPSSNLDPSKWRVQNWMASSSILSYCIFISLFSSWATESKHSWLIIEKLMVSYCCWSKGWGNYSAGKPSKNVSTQ